MGFATGPETDKFPIIKARWFDDIVKKREVQVIVIHTMEAPEKGNTAENVAKFFQSLPSNRKASAHLCIDNNSIVQCVLDNDVAFGVPGANHNGIQLELAGFAKQTREEWFDAYSKDLLENAANAAAQYCLKYNIPRKHLTNDQLRSGQEGIIGHVQASEVFNLSDHTDPGTEFPWDHFLERVEHYYTERKEKLSSK